MHPIKAFRNFIITLQDLTRALENNTKEQRELRGLLQKVATSTDYLAKEKRASVRRSGHQTVS